MRSISSVTLLIWCLVTVAFAEDKVPNFTSVQAETTINTIISSIGLQPNFELQSAAIYSASATIINGKRYIFYNPDFFTKLNQQTGTEWASVSILAHEIGHHLNGHTLLGANSTSAIELEADEFSGFVLFKMGASLDDSQIAIKQIANVQDSETHPGRAKRLIAIAQGWNRAHVQSEVSLSRIPVTRKIDENTKKIVQLQRKPTEPPKTVPKNYLVYVVKLHAQPGVTYFLTAQNNLVRKYNNQYFIVGKIKRTGKTTYPYVLSGNSSSFFVSQTGLIVNKQGINAGYVKKVKG